MVNRPLSAHCARAHRPPRWSYAQKGGERNHITGSTGTERIGFPIPGRSRRRHNMGRPYPGTNRWDLA